MAITGPTELSPSVRSGLIPGLGYMAIVTLAMDASMLSAGEIVDLSGIFPTIVFGGVVIKDTDGDGGFKFSLVSGASTASYLIQTYTQPATALSGPMVISGAQNAVAVDGQTWLFFGR